MNIYKKMMGKSLHLFVKRKLINVKVISNNQIAVYFVTGIEMDDNNWEQ